MSIEPGRMFALDITSGSMCYSRTLEQIQPLAIAVYDTESEVSFYSKQLIGINIVYVWRYKNIKFYV